MNYYKAKVVYECYGELDTDNMLIAASTYSEAVSAIEKYYESNVIEMKIELFSNIPVLSESAIKTLNLDFTTLKGES